MITANMSAWCRLSIVNPASSSLHLQNKITQRKESEGETDEDEGERTCGSSLVHIKPVHITSSSVSRAHPQLIILHFYRNSADFRSFSPFTNKDCAHVRNFSNHVACIACLSQHTQDDSLTCDQCHTVISVHLTRKNGISRREIHCRGHRTGH